MADRPVSLALGYEYRNHFGANIPDPVTVAGLTTGNKGLITKGGYHVNEGFGELSIPILSNMPGVQLLEATAALRLFNYNTFGSDNTYKFGARWQIVRDLTVRGTYSTAFRAPSIGDLFGGQADSFPPSSDPCRRANAPPSCGAAANNGDTTTQLRSRVGGNTELKPETSKAFTAGIVIEPRMVKNLTITVDYYNFNVESSISSYGVNVILAGCYPATGAGDPKYCALVQRDPTTQFITYVYNLNANVGSDATDGVDLAVRYVHPTDVGRFGFVFDANFLHKFNRTLADGTEIHARGNYDLGGGIGGVYPALKFNAGVSWALRDFTAGVSTRYISKYRECGDAGGLMNGSGVCYSDSTYSRTVHPYNTYDLYLGYNLASGAGKTTIAAGILNVFDRDPAVVYNGFLAATDPTAYDVTGRQVYARMSHAF
jgi:outer membrane receptor protein involved in Fe transport